MADYTGKQLGNYRLVRWLGRGASAEVYLGEHVHLGTFAAIKVLSGLVEGYRSDDFRGEAQIVAHMRHPHIVRVLDFGVESNLPFLVMDYVPNGTLRQRYPPGTILPLFTIVSYTKQIAEALQYAHDHKITHRDVKPENMLLDINDQVLLSDFGISAIEPTTRSLPTLNHASTEQAGTPIYMAPEQIQGNPRFASDQYALAVVVYEWICGARPFSGDLLAVIYQHVHAQPPSLRETLPTISPGIEQVILKALAKDPQQRYRTILDFANALEEAVQMDVGLTFLRPLPAVSLPPPPMAAAPIQPIVFQPKSASAIRARHLPAPAKSKRLVQERHVPAPHRIMLYLAFASVLIAGSFAFAIALVRTHAQATVATTPVSTYAHTTVTASVNPYNAAAIANGVMDGFDAQHTHVNPYEKIITPTTVKGLQMAWQMPTGGKIESAATVANDIVYISSCSKQMFAFRATTRATVWSNSNGSCDFGNAPTFAKGVVYMGAPDGYLYAYDANTGNIRWSAFTRGSIGSSPTLASNVIYVGSDDHTLYAFSASGCGQSACPPLWTRSTGGAIRSSPAVYNGVVYVGSDDHKLYAFDATTGKPYWQFLTGGGIDSSPTVYNDVVYVGSNDGKLYANNTANGYLLWTANTKGPIESSPTIANGVLFIGSNDGSLYAYAAGCGRLSCREIWSYLLTKDSFVSSPVVANGYVYVGSHDGNLYAFDTGKA
jgi:eukaryotic-like serine/threonine-protein kinase